MVWHFLEALTFFSLQWDPCWLLQVRVMPECCFVLLRFWLRVDRVLVRLYETRFLADFRAGPGQPQVTREVRCCEGTFESLHAAGAPPDGVRSLPKVCMSLVHEHLQTVFSPWNFE
jgi:hypothetical protein